MNHALSNEGASICRTRFHTIAKARLAAMGGKNEEAVRALTELETKLKDDPAAGEDLRRVRWALDRTRMR